MLITGLIIIAAIIGIGVGIIIGEIRAYSKVDREYKKQRDIITKGLSDHHQHYSN